MGAGAPTPITVLLSLQGAQSKELIKRSAFVRSRRNGSSYIEHDSPAEQRIVAGAAILVENGRDPAVTQGPSREGAFCPGAFHKVYRKSPKAGRPDLLCDEKRDPARL